MMIAPIIFCTIVVGVGSIAKAATVGKIGGLALLYFMVMSTFALAIGLVVGNIIHPGEGLNMANSTYEAVGRGQDDRGVHPRHHPDDLLLGVRRRERPPGAVHRTARRLRTAGHGREGPADHVGRQAPAVARVPHPGHDPVARTHRRVRRDRRRGGIDRGRGDLEPRHPDGRVLHHVHPLHRRHPGHAAVRRHADQHLQPDEVPRPRVPADRRHVVERVGAPAPHREDGAPRHPARRGGHHRPDGLLVQPRRHRDLPDDGVAVHRLGHGRADVDPASRSGCWSS